MSCAFDCSVVFFLFFESDIDYKTKDVGNVHDLPDMNQCNTGWFIGTLMIEAYENSPNGSIYPPKSKKLYIRIPGSPS